MHEAGRDPGPGMGGQQEGPREELGDPEAAGRGSQRIGSRCKSKCRRFAVFGVRAPRAGAAWASPTYTRWLRAPGGGWGAPGRGRRAEGGQDPGQVTRARPSPLGSSRARVERGPRVHTGSPRPAPPLSRSHRSAGARGPTQVRAGGRPGRPRPAPPPPPGEGVTWPGARGLGTRTAAADRRPAASRSRRSGSHSLARPARRGLIHAPPPPRPLPRRPARAAPGGGAAPPAFLRRPPPAARRPGSRRAPAPRPGGLRPRAATAGTPRPHRAAEGARCPHLTPHPRPGSRGGGDVPAWSLGNGPARRGGRSFRSGSGRGGAAAGEAGEAAGREDGAPGAHGPPAHTDPARTWALPAPPHSAPPRRQGSPAQTSLRRGHGTRRHRNLHPQSPTCTSRPPHAHQQAPLSPHTHTGDPIHTPTLPLGTSVLPVSPQTFRTLPEAPTTCRTLPASFSCLPRPSPPGPFVPVSGSPCPPTLSDSPHQSSSRGSEQCPGHSAAVGHLAGGEGGGP